VEAAQDRDAVPSPLTPIASTCAISEHIRSDVRHAACDRNGTGSRPGALIDLQPIVAERCRSNHAEVDFPTTTTTLPG